MRNPDMPTLLRSRTLWIFLLIVGLIRLITLSVYPLMDTTEARYGEMARMMVETGNHESLMAGQGFYYRLYHLRSNGSQGVANGY